MSPIGTLIAIVAIFDEVSALPFVGACVSHEISQNQVKTQSPSVNLKLSYKSVFSKVSIYS